MPKGFPFLLGSVTAFLLVLAQRSQLARGVNADALLNSPDAKRRVLKTFAFLIPTFLAFGVLVASLDSWIEQHSLFSTLFLGVWAVAEIVVNSWIYRFRFWGIIITIIWAISGSFFAIHSFAITGRLGASDFFSGGALLLVFAAASYFVSFLRR